MMKAALLSLLLDAVCAVGINKAGMLFASVFALYYCFVCSCEDLPCAGHPLMHPCATVPDVEA